MLEKIRKITGSWYQSDDHYNAQGDIKKRDEDLCELVADERAEAVKDFITETYGEKCKSKDIEDFPELQGDPKASRCPTCEMWEIYDKWLGGQDSNLR